MASIDDLKSRLQFRKTALKELHDAYTAIASGQVQSYTIGSRNLTKLDLTKLKKEIDDLEKEIDVLESKVAGRKPRRAVGVIPRDI